MAAKVGGVILDIMTNVGRVKKDTDEIKRHLNKFSSDAKKIFRTIGYSLGAAFSVYSIKKFIAEGVKTIDTLQDMSKSAAMATRDFQGLTQAAKYAGVEQQGVATAIKALNTNLYNARHGLAESKRIFEDLNINIWQDTTEVLYQMSDRFKNMTDETFRAGIAAKALGRSGTALIPVLEGGSEKLKEVTERLESFGAIVTDETMETIDKVNQNIIDMGTALKGIKLQILSGMADELERITNVFVNNPTAWNKFEGLGDTLGKIGIGAMKGALGVAGFMDVFGTAAGVMTGIGVEGPFNVEIWKEGMAEVQRTIEQWGAMIQQLNQKPKITGDSILRGAGGGARHYIDIGPPNKTEALEWIVQYRSEWEKTEETTKTIWEGMKAGFTDYYETIKDRNAQIVSATVNGMKTMEDALVDFCMTGKMAWQDLANQILADIARIVIRQQVIAPLMGGITSVFSGATWGSMQTGAGPPRPSLAGRRGRTYTGATINLSNEMVNIVTENTTVMNRQVENFVKQSEKRFDDLGKRLRRNLDFTTAVSTRPAGGYIPAGGIGGGGTISGGVMPGGGVINLEGYTAPVDAVMEAIRNTTVENIAKALFETNFITIVSKWGLSLVEDVYDALFGENSADKLIDKITTSIKGMSYDDLNVGVVATKWSAGLVEAAIDGVFGEGTADDMIDQIEDKLKSLNFESAIVPAAVNLATGLSFATTSAVFGKDAVQKAMDAVKDGLKAVSANNTYLLANINTWGIGIFQAGVDGLFGKDTTQKIIDDVKDNIKGLPFRKAVTSAAVNWSIGLSAAILDAMFGTDIIEKARDAVKEATETIWEKLVEEIKAQAEAITSGGGGVDWQDVVFPFFNPVKTVKDIFGSVFGGGGGGGEINWDLYNKAKAEGKTILDYLFEQDHIGGMVGGAKGYIPRLHKGLNPDEYPAILQRGEMVIPKDQVGSGGITINVPINIAERNPLFASELRREVENAVFDVMRKYI